MIGVLVFIYGVITVASFALVVLVGTIDWLNGEKKDVPTPISVIAETATDATHYWNRMTWLGRLTLLPAATLVLSPFVIGAVPGFLVLHTPANVKPILTRLFFKPEVK